MEWTPDDEDLPIDIPGNLLDLEKLGPERLNAMTRQELEDRLQDASKVAAQSYLNTFPDGHYEACVLVVSTLLQKVGTGVDASVGSLIVAESESWAKAGCGEVFDHELP
jgi:hypothetical protein